MLIVPYSKTGGISRRGLPIEQNDFWETIDCLKKATISAAAKRVHRQLFLALIAQTTIPFVVSFLPCLLIWYSPLFEVDLGRFNNNYTIPMFSAFPFCDPIAIIAIFSEYRTYVLNILGYPFAGSIGLIVRCSFISLSYGILEIHFIYRYIALCRPKLIHWFTHPLYITGWLIFWLSFGGIWAFAVSLAYPDEDDRKFLRETFRVTYNVDVDDLGLIAINKFLKVSTISFTAKRVHRQLFLALVAQTTIPFVVSFLPCMFLWYTPLFGVNLGSFNNDFTIPMFSAFPCLNKKIDMSSPVLGKVEVQIDVGFIPKWFPRFFCLLSFILNPLLVYIVITQNKCKIGPYRQFLVCFAIFDMTYSAVDVIVGMATHHYETSFSVFVSHGPLVDNQPIADVGLVIRCSFICLSYGILDLHFIYRYIALCRPKLLHWFTQPLYIIGCALAYLNEEDRDFLRETFLVNYNANIDEMGILGVRYKARTIVRTCTVMLMGNLMSVAVIISYCVMGYKVEKFIKQHG
ncbi:unnamed protein product [Caenorhabditis auriculariae]|uniref:Uncharacterized protein n=1 Tax=Caenorhabditis auriculariae TaxID=2777116 RepID=A0A8S1HBT6_9PELO|nr:unnamed protein product [Caenorhabditis auriculariae]